MILVEKHIIKSTNPYTKELGQLCFLSKNLYNQVLYRHRQYYFNNHKYLNKYQLINDLTKEQQIDYISLPRKVSQQIIFQVDEAMQTFFKLLKKKKGGEYNKCIAIPKYKDKVKGKNKLVFTSQAISSKNLKFGFITFGKTINFKIRTKQKNIKQVEIIPKYGHFIVNVLYEVKELPIKENNNKYAAIDFGINNLMSVTFNDENLNPIIINGKPLKSINHYYNKQKALYQSIQDNKNKKQAYANKLIKLSLKRNNKINDYLHKASRFIVNHLVSNHINTLIVGYNKTWKQDTNLGRRNNQNFVQIPFYCLLQMLKYKCELEGINVILQEESFTSKASFFDNDIIPSINDCKCSYIFSGKRIKRGLYKTSNGTLINADINGSLNIMKKAVSNAFNKGYEIQVCSMPKVINLKA